VNKLYNISVQIRPKQHELHAAVSAQREAPVASTY